jgi:hypothetical protein
MIRGLTVYCALEARRDRWILTITCGGVFHDLPGWTWALYAPTASMKARAVLIRPDYRVQVGCDGETVEQALCAALEAARRKK